MSGLRAWASAPMTASVWNATQPSALAGPVSIATCHAVMMRKTDIMAQGTKIAMAATAATWTSSTPHRRPGRSLRTMAPRTAAPKSANAPSQSGDTGAPRIGVAG